jgi:hypothetical protein
VFLGGQKGSFLSIFGHFLSIFNDFWSFLIKNTPKTPPKTPQKGSKNAGGSQSLFFHRRISRVFAPVFALFDPPFTPFLTPPF